MAGGIDAALSACNKIWRGLIAARYRDSFIGLVEDYDPGQDRKRKAAWLSAKLGLRLPPSADR